MIENLEAFNIGVFNKDGLFVINTENNNYLNKCYLIFHTDINYYINELFEELIFCYNETNSKITSEYLLILFNLYTINELNKNKDKLLKNYPIYFPLNLFFQSKPVYIKNQQVSFRLLNIKKNVKIELAYEILSYTDNKTIKINNKIPIDVFSVFTLDLKNDLSIKLSNNLKEIFWMYKNEGIICHPVEIMNFKIKNTNYKTMDLIYEYPKYFNYDQQFNHKFINYNNINPNLYCYFLYPSNEYFDNKLCLTRNVKYIKFDQLRKEEYKTLKHCKQSFCLKSLVFVDIITDEEYLRHKKFRHLFFCLKFKNKFRKWLWEYVRQKHVQTEFHPNKIINLLKKGVDILIIDYFLPKQNY